MNESGKWGPGLLTNLKPKERQTSPRRQKHFLTCARCFWLLVRIRLKFPTKCLRSVQSVRAYETPGRPRHKGVPTHSRLFSKDLSRCSQKRWGAEWESWESVLCGAALGEGKIYFLCGAKSSRPAGQAKDAGEGQKRPITSEGETGIDLGSPATVESRAGWLVMPYLWDSGKLAPCLPPVRVTQDPENTVPTLCPPLWS